MSLKRWKQTDINEKGPRLKIYGLSGCFDSSILQQTRTHIRTNYTNLRISFKRSDDKRPLKTTVNSENEFPESRRDFEWKDLACT